MNISWALGFIFEDFALGDVWEAILAAIIIAIVFLDSRKSFWDSRLFRSMVFKISYKYNCI